jgi:hypothetical protein
MSEMRHHLVLTTVGLLLGVVALPWIQPNTSAGATFLVLCFILLANAAGALRRRSHPAKKPRRRGLWGALLPIALVQSSCATKVPAPPLEVLLDRASQALHDHDPTTADRWLAQAVDRAKASQPAPPPDSIAQARAALAQHRDVLADWLITVARRQQQAEGSAVGAIAGGLLGGLLGKDQQGAVIGAAVGAIAGGGHSAQDYLVPVRVYLAAADIPPPTLRAYGILALRTKPTPANRARLTMACHAFIAALIPDTALTSRTDAADRMLTIWPIADPGAAAAQHDDCDFLLDNYELFGGVAALQDLEREGDRLDGRGPFLIAWSPAAARGHRDAATLIVDMSGFESQDSFDSALVFWQSRVVDQPSTWRSGFSIEAIRLALRDFVDHYGQDILGALRFWSGKS